MNGKIMVCFIGQQPVPNLLPILFYKPDGVLLVCSDFTRPAADSLVALLGDKQLMGLHCAAEICVVPAYAVEKSKALLAQALALHQPSQLLFNLTGGTKLMSHAGYEVAREQTECLLLYLESERNCNYSYEYTIADDGSLAPNSTGPRLVPGLLTIELYLRAQGITPGVGKTKGDLAGIKFEAELAATFSDALAATEVDEVKVNITDSQRQGVEIDLLVRCGNQIAVLEAKQGKKASGLEGVKQLQTYASNLYLGTYARRFLVLDRNAEPVNEELAKLVGITVVHLYSYAKENDVNLKVVSASDRQLLIAEVTKRLRCNL